MEFQEREGVVAMGGKPLTLLGPELAVGEPAPDFRVVDAALEPVRLSDFDGRARLISAVPSIDTGVCAMQTKRFNDELEHLPSDVVVMTISMDLPFAQKRFCEAEKVEGMMMTSDHVWREFGLAYGVLIKDIGLLARSIFVVGKDGKLLYKQVVPELTDHPDYDAALAAAKAAAQ